MMKITERSIAAASLDERYSDIADAVIWFVEPMDSRLINVFGRKAAGYRRNTVLSRKVSKIIVFFNKCDLLDKDDAESGRKRVQDICQKAIDFKKLHDLSDYIIYGSALKNREVALLLEEIEKVNDEKTGILRTLSRWLSSR